MMDKKTWLQHAFGGHTQNKTTTIIMTDSEEKDRFSPGNYDLTSMTEGTSINIPHSDTLSNELSMLSSLITLIDDCRGINKGRVGGIRMMLPGSSALQEQNVQPQSQHPSSSSSTPSPDLQSPVKYPPRYFPPLFN
jgi:hypothetical protein